MTLHLDASRSILSRVDGRNWMPGRALVIAGAAVVIEEAETEAGFAAALSLPRPSLALPAAAAAEAAGPRSRTQRLTQLTRTIPVPERPLALLAAEPFLARIDAEWSMNLIVAAVGAKVASENALGLSIAAHQQSRSLPIPEWIALAPRSSLLARQFAADALLIAVVRRKMADEGDPTWRTLVENPDALLDTEAAAVLAASGLMEPASGLVFARRLLQYHTPQALQESIEIAAAAAVDEGLGEQVCELARAREFVSEQAAWLLAAARSGAMAAEELALLAGELAPRVSDELDPDRAWLAGVPLLAALCHVGRTEGVIELATTWKIAIHSLADEFFAAGDGQAARELAETNLPDSLFEHDDFPTEDQPGWWLDANNDPALRRRATLDVLVLSQFRPWGTTPGSVSDIAGFAQG